MNRTLSFAYGSTTSTWTAADVRASGIGVCRDFTHLAISYCRALNIPARYVFGYLPELEVPPLSEPMDFAAWMEVFLDGRWWTFARRHRLAENLAPRRLTGTTSDSIGRVRIATWNVNSITARLPRLLEWLRDTAPDAVALQETKVADAAFPIAALEALGYQVAAHGDGRWNGVALLSRIGLSHVARGLHDEPGFPAVESRAIGATCGGVRLWSAYVPNGREPGHEHYTYKLAWLEALRTTLAADLPSSPNLAVMGDFNVAPTDDDVFDPAAFVGSTHVTGPERSALTALRETGLVDVVPRPLKYDRPFTYWDYRAGMFHKNLGMRIDLVYATPTVAGAVRDAYVDRDARKGKGPSDHAPVVVDLDLP